MVYFARHGSKEITKGYDDYYNNELIILDIPLSEKGREEARQLAEYFRSIDIKKIFVSQYQRAHQTAAPTAASKGLPLIEDSRVNEINNGQLRNMSDEEIEAKLPSFWKDFMSRTRDVTFPDGESGEGVKKRQDSFLNDIKDETGDILVVSHDGYIRLLMCNILGLPVYKRYKFKTDVGCVSVIRYDSGEGEWKILAFNQKV